MALSKSARRRTAPASSVGSDVGTSAADATVCDGDVDMCEDPFAYDHPDDNTVVNTAPGALADAIDLDPLDRSLLEGVECDSVAEGAFVTDGASVGGKDASLTVSNDSAVGSDSAGGTDASFQSVPTDAVEPASSEGEFLDCRFERLCLKILSECIVTPIQCFKSIFRLWWQ